MQHKKKLKKKKRKTVGIVYLCCKHEPLLGDKVDDSRPIESTQDDSLLGDEKILALDQLNIIQRSHASVPSLVLQAVDELDWCLVKERTRVGPLTLVGV